MNDACIISGSMVDAKNVGVHKSLRLYIDVPQERAKEVIEKLGWPTQANPVPVAIARLQTGSTKLAVQQTAQDETPAQAAPDLPNKPPVRPLYPQQAGYLCNSVSFIRFLKEKMPDAWGKSRGVEDQPAPENSIRAAKIIRHYCGVDSRKDILPGTEAENRFLLLVSSYRAWQDAPRMGAA